MSRIKLKQILSNLHYNASLDQLVLSSSRTPIGNLSWDEISGSWDDAFGTWDGTRGGIPDFVISGSVEVTQSLYSPGTITIKGVDTFGDSGSFYSIDLGEF